MYLMVVQIFHHMRSLGNIAYMQDHMLNLWTRQFNFVHVFTSKKYGIYIDLLVVYAEISTFP